jgi:hypothetical protein
LVTLQKNMDFCWFNQYRIPFLCPLQIMPLIYSNRDKHTCHDNLKSYPVPLVVSSSSSSKIRSSSSKSRSSSCSHLSNSGCGSSSSSSSSSSCSCNHRSNNKSSNCFFVAIIVDRELMRTDKDHANAKCLYVFGTVSDSVLREKYEQSRRRADVCGYVLGFSKQHMHLYITS